MVMLSPLVSLLMDSFGFVAVGISAGGALVSPAFVWVLGQFERAVVFASVAVLERVPIEVSVSLRRFRSTATIVGEWT
jgi:hypothetical protein